MPAKGFTRRLHKPAKVLSGRVLLHGSFLLRFPASRDTPRRRTFVVWTLASCSGLEIGLWVGPVCIAEADALETKPNAKKMGAQQCEPSSTFRSDKRHYQTVNLAEAVVAENLSCRRKNEFKLIESVPSYLNFSLGNRCVEGILTACACCILNFANLSPKPQQFHKPGSAESIRQ